ncbi:MAG: ABC transporter permease, partial [Gemmataceae bacterium]|nr:ABC transporter permease [Gemmataceae bacterium]
MSLVSLDAWVMGFLADPLNVALACGLVLLLMLAWAYSDQAMLYVRLIVKSFTRNALRSTLTSLAIMVLVLVVTLVWSVLFLLDRITSEKASDFKAIVSERWQIPSQMPMAYAAELARGSARTEADERPNDHMNWTFYGGTIDPTKRTRENIIFFFGMDPAKMLSVERDKDGKPVRDAEGRIRFSSMMDDIDQATEEELLLLDRACREMEKDRRKVVIGRDKLADINKRVGDRITVTSFNYPGIDLEVEIIGTFPRGRYDNSSLVNAKYILEGLDAWKSKNGGKPHPMADKALNLVWLKVPSTEAFRKVADQVMSSPTLTPTAVKAETASSGIASFLDSYRDLLSAVRWYLVPAIVVTLVLVIANSISISVRERRNEMAVLKVLGYGPNQILGLVIGEALFLGVVSGLLS